MDTDTGILTNLLNLFAAAMTGGAENLSTQALSLLYWLILIELAVFTVMRGLFGMQIGDLVFRVIVIGMVTWITTNFFELVQIIMDSFFQIGLIAANADMQPVEMRDPSSILDVGFSITTPIAEYLSNMSLWESLNSDTVLLGLAMIGILLAFAFISVLLLVFYLVFLLIATIGVVFVPFGVLTQTNSIMGNIIHAVFSFGVRFAMLSAIIAIGSSVIQSFELTTDPTWKECFVMLTASWSLAVLAWFGPSIAESLLAGSSVLSSGSLASATIGGATGVKHISEQSRSMATSSKSLANVAAAASVAGLSAIKSATKTSVDKAAQIPNGF